MELLILRVIHVVGGIFWVGTMVFNAFFLGPAMAAAGPAAGPIAINLQKQRIFTVLPITAILTMLAGIRLMMITSAGSPAYFSQPNGRTYAVGALFAIAAFLVGMIVTRPAMTRTAALAGAAASDEITRDRIAAEVRAMQRRASVSTRVVAVLLLVAAICMSIARYL